MLITRLYHLDEMGGGDRWARWGWNVNAHTLEKWVIWDVYISHIDSTILNEYHFQSLSEQFACNIIAITVQLFSSQCTPTIPGNVKETLEVTQPYGLCANLANVAQTGTLPWRRKRNCRVSHRLPSTVCCLRSLAAHSQKVLWFRMTFTDICHVTLSVL